MERFGLESKPVSRWNFASLCPDGYEPWHWNAACRGRLEEGCPRLARLHHGTGGSQESLGVASPFPAAGCAMEPAEFLGEEERPAGWSKMSLSRWTAGSPLRLPSFLNGQEVWGGEKKDGLVPPDPQTEAEGIGRRWDKRRSKRRQAG